MLGAGSLYSSEEGCVMQCPGRSCGIERYVGVDQKGFRVWWCNKL